MSDSSSDTDTAIENKTGVKHKPRTSLQAISASFKPPSFWPSNPTLWFNVLEAEFDFSGIKSDRRKYLAVVRGLDEKTVVKISDIVTRPPEKDKYESIKKALIERIAPSEDSNLQKLLKDLELGDRKPSDLLREMKSLAGNQVSEEVVKKLWLQRLPSQTTAILTISKEPIDSLATMADKIVETYSSQNTSVMSVANNKPQSSKSNNHDHEIVSQIEELKREFQSFKSRQSNRNRSSSASRNNSKPKLCFYHRRFKKEAKKCTQPCDWVDREQKN